MSARKVALGLTLLVACTYDADRLLPPDPGSGAYSPSADAGSKPTVGDPSEGQTDPATFVQGRAQGAMSGLGYVSLGVFGKLTSPTCAGMPIASLPPEDPPVTFDSTCWPSSIKWSSSSALCVSGTLPAWSATPSFMEYQTNWGILVGAATRDPVRGLGVDYARVALTWTGEEALTRLLAVVHLEGDAANKTYCAPVTSGGSVRLTSFNTDCSFGSGDLLPAADVRKIDKVGVQIPSRRTALKLENFCLNKIVFTK